jgi:hypothetical protein
MKKNFLEGGLIGLIIFIISVVILLPFPVDLFEINKSWMLVASSLLVPVWFVESIDKFLFEHLLILFALATAMSFVCGGVIGIIIYPFCKINRKKWKILVTTIILVATLWLPVYYYSNTLIYEFSKWRDNITINDRKPIINTLVLTDEVTGDNILLIGAHNLKTAVTNIRSVENLSIKIKPSNSEDVMIVWSGSTKVNGVSIRIPLTGFAPGKYLVWMEAEGKGKSNEDTFELK